MQKKKKKKKLKSSMTVSGARWRPGNWRPSGDLGFIRRSCSTPALNKNPGGVPKSGRRHRFQPNQSIISQQVSKQTSTFPLFICLFIYCSTRVTRKGEGTRICIRCRSGGAADEATPDSPGPGRRCRALLYENTRLTGKNPPQKNPRSVKRLRFLCWTCIKHEVQPLP